MLFDTLPYHRNVSQCDALIRMRVKVDNLHICVIELKKFELSVQFKKAKGYCLHVYLRMTLNSPRIAREGILETQYQSGHYLVFTVLDLKIPKPAPISIAAPF